MIATHDMAALWTAARDGDISAWPAIADALEEAGHHEALNIRAIGLVVEAGRGLPTGTVKTEWSGAIRKAAGHKGRSPLLLYCCLAPVRMTGDYADGGSRTRWTALRLADGRVFPQSGAGYLTADADAPRWEPSPGFILIEHGYFQGRAFTPSVRCHPLDYATLVRAS